MNTYSKFCPNVFLAKCSEPHQRGDVIEVTSKHGKENESIVFNLVKEKDGFFYYSIVRADGFNVQEHARRKAEKYEDWASSAAQKSNVYYNKSNDAVRHIPLGQPILVGHHSENAHRRALKQSWDAMGKSVELSDRANNHEHKAEYWKERENIINLSMPESIEFFAYKLEQAKEIHEDLKKNPEKRRHSYSLTYAKKEVNEVEKKYKIAVLLWGE